MSKLDNLIAELCPAGVEYKLLKEISLMQRGTSLTKANAVEGDIPVISGGKEPAFYCDTANRDGETITVAGSGAGAGYVQYWNVQIFANDCFTVKGNDVIETKYLYYYMSNIQDKISDTKKGGGVPHVHISDVENFKVPVPPLEIQREIVRILDTFTELTAELTAELKARRKQYEYYHNTLTDFTDRVDVKWCSVGEYFTFKNGINKDKSCFGSGDYIVNFTDVYNNRWITKDTLKGRVQTEDKDLKAYDTKYGDIFFTRTSETKEDIGMVSALVDDIERCVFSGFVLRARPNTDNWIPKFCSYYFSSHSIRMEIVKYASFTTRALTSGPRLSKLQIPLISKEEQQRIVDILDNFSYLCNELNDGIPAEIEARKKQYEYYRDKLLSFKELGA